MPIRVLPPQVANKIAAGEVVERPASVVKELTENAIDAGATDIRIEIRQGGRRSIRVSDNGCGIPRGEAALAFARHATSKISSEDDLSHIQTLGFRGEALASIAAVSQVTLITRAASEEAGTLLRLEGGEPQQNEKHGGTPGTVITVENLFYNTPARLKFLRSEATESSHITKLASAYAMAYPGLRFHLTDNGRLALQTLGTGKLYDVLVKVFGLEVAQQMLELAPEEQRLPNDAVEAASSTPEPFSEAHVYGYIGSPSLHRATRDYEIFFVNRRWIQDRSLGFAVEEAYRTLLPVGRYPVAVLSITMDPGDVDVNVHPTKREVRFREPRSVFAAVQKAVRHAISGQAPVAPITARPQAIVPGEWDRWRTAAVRQHVPPIGVDRAQMALEIQRAGDMPPVPVQSTPMREQLPMLRVLGQVRQMYIIAEGPDGLYLIDQHAAHERILFEQLQTEKAAMSVSTQNLLEPLPIELLPQQRRPLEAMAEHLAAFGFDIAPFGGDTYLVRAIPTTLTPGEVPGVIAELLDVAAEGRDPVVTAEQALDIIACHSAVRAGQTLALDEARELIHQLEKTTSPYTCPHGRPTMIHLSTAQLERSFDRR
jgi:DNA mismatch repair protein MutL